MVDINAVERIKCSEVSAKPREQDSYTQESSPSKESLNPVGLPLHQVFGQDVLENTPSDTTISVEESATAITDSLWNKLLSLFKKSDSAPVVQGNLSQNVEEVILKKPETINPIPILEQPDHIPEDLKTEKLLLPQGKNNNKLKLHSADIEEALLLMSSRSIESIMFIVFKMQTQLEKDHVVVAEGTHSKYLEFQKMQQQLLSDIKDVIVKDENVAKHFGTAKNIALFATFVAGAISVAASYGLMAPLWAGLSTATSAGLAATTQAGGSYFQRRLDEHNADRENYTHHDRYYGDRLEDTRNRLMSTAEADTVFKERWGQFLKRSDKMRKLILSK